MKRRWLLAGFALVVVCAVAVVVYFSSRTIGQAAPRNGRPLELSDFAAVDTAKDFRIQLEGKFAPVKQELGTPNEVTTLSHGGGGALTVYQAVFPELTIQYAEPDGSILAISVRGKGFRTPRGIEVGSPERAVEQAYGAPTYRFQGNLQYVLAPSEQIDRYQLTFVISGSRVSTIWAFVPVQ